MKLPSLQSLYSTAMVIAVGGIGGIFILRMNKLNDISGSPYFREAFKILRAHQGAVQLLGEPIKQLGFDPVDVNNWCDGTRAKFHVRVKGPKDKGIIYFWATTDAEGKWIINRLELELKSEKNRRLLVKDGPCDPE